jgi:sialidase-1
MDMANPCHVEVFVSGQEGYQAFRIPVIETAADGSLLAFAEARKRNCGDPGTENNEVHLVLKRSRDSGRTWSAMTVIENPGDSWSAANPTSVLDRRTGRIWLHYIRCKPGRGSVTARPGTDDIRNLVRYSDDHGVGWSEPADLTAVCRDMADPQWACTVVGPGGGIQDRQGRLVVPCWKFPFGVFVVFSEDHGQTWQRGGMVPGNHGGDEDQLVELADGRLLLDFRQEEGPHRWIAISSDGGRTWSEPHPGQTVTPVCCAIKRYTLKAAGDDRDRIVWTGPKGPERRTHLVVRVSEDEAESFPRERLIAGGPVAYSSLTLLPDKSMGVLWERGPYQFIVFSRLDREFLLGIPDQQD